MTEKLYLNPMGYTTVHPDVELPRIDRAAVLRNAHVIAKRYRAGLRRQLRRRAVLRPQGRMGAVASFPLNPVACRASDAPHFHRGRDRHQPRCHPALRFLVHRYVEERRP
jgi:hypothetical protein